MSCERSWAASTFDAFRFPLYRVVWLGSFFAFMAFNMASTAQGVVAFDLTGSNHAVGFVAFGQGLAMFFLNPFGGAIADRFSKRLLLLVAQFVIGGVMFAMAVLLAFDAITIFYLALGSFIMGTMFSFLGPTRTSLLAEYVEPERIGNAMALMQVGNNFSRIGGPMLAGMLLAWPLHSAPTGVYFLDASIFIFVLLTLSRLPESQEDQHRPQPQRPARHPPRLPLHHQPAATAAHGGQLPRRHGAGAVELRAHAGPVQGGLRRGQRRRRHPAGRLGCGRFRHEPDGGVAGGLEARAAAHRRLPAWRLRSGSSAWALRRASRWPCWVWSSSPAARLRSRR